MREKRIKLYNDFIGVAKKNNELYKFEKRYGKISDFENTYKNWAKINFADENSVLKLREKSFEKKILKNLSVESFFKKFACDLKKFKNNNYCSFVNTNTGTTNTNTGSTTNSGTTNTNTGTTITNTDTSANSPNKMDDPGGGGKIYNITGDPYKWRIGKDGGWWAKRDTQTQWNNISGQVNRGDKPNWKISIDTMDREYFGGDSNKRVAAKDLNEGVDISSKMTLGKFFLD